MATADDLITLPRLRDALGLIGDESDVLLVGSDGNGGMRSAAIGWLENWLSRSILDRAGVTSDESAFAYIESPDLLYFGMRDIKPDSTIVLRYADVDADPSGARTETMTLQADSVLLNRNYRGVSIYRDPTANTTWREFLRYTHPIPTITANQGMAAGDIPAQWGEAATLIVRALYDGSAYDALDKMSVLSLMLKSWKPVAMEDSP